MIHMGANKGGSVMGLPKILIAEDEERLRRLIGMLLGHAGYRLTLVGDGEEACQQLERATFDLVITDLKMPHLDGMALIGRIHEKTPELPVIVITAFGSIESAVEAMKAGAIDYITKPFEEEKLKLAVERGLRIRRILAENRVLRREVVGRWTLDHIITRSPLMLAAIEMARRVAPSLANVMVYGESGTGKELITRGIHAEGPRAAGPFMAINCAAIPDNLIESELFGHEKGSFTGAGERKRGKFELADGGTLFLDEVAELSLNVQAKVLRAIENREIQRVGSTDLIHVDMRMIAATNKNLRHEVDEGKFRDDLFFRLNVFPIHLPPLRSRPEDIVPLVEHFLKIFCAQMGKHVPSIPPATAELLQGDAWVGNVRELQNAVERAVILLQGDELTPDLIRKEPFLAPRPVLDASPDESFRLPDGNFSLEEHEKMLIRQALERAHYKKSAAARLLGLSRATLRYRMDKYGFTGEDGDEAMIGGKNGGEHDDPVAVKGD